jgi:hypothetical protein
VIVEIKRASQGQSDVPPIEKVERVDYVTDRGHKRHAWVRDMTDADILEFLREESPVIVYFGGVDYPEAEFELIIYDDYFE